MQTSSCASYTHTSLQPQAALPLAWGYVDYALRASDSKLNQKYNSGSVLTKGKYVIWGILTMWASPETINMDGGDSREDDGSGNGNMYGFMEWSCPVSVSFVKATKNYKKVELGSDGICVYSNANSYFYCSKEYGVEAKFGGGGIRCTETQYDEDGNVIFEGGLYKLSGKKWISL